MKRYYTRVDKSGIPELEIVFRPADFENLTIKLEDDYELTGEIHYSNGDLVRLLTVQQLLMNVANDIADLVWAAGHGEIHDTPF